MSLQEFYDKRMELVWTTIGAIKAIINSPAYTDEEKIEHINRELARLKENNQKIRK